MPETCKVYYSSEIGVIEIVGTREGIGSVNFVEDADDSAMEIPGFFKSWIKQLDEYFKGRRKEFSIPLLIHGTVFQKKVWGALIDIPYGTTQSYADIARKIGHKNAFRAVGNASNKNRIAIFIPCHRVIGRNGSLTGYAAGIWRKQWLLEHEKKYS